MFIFPHTLLSTTSFPLPQHWSTAPKVHGQLGRMAGIQCRTHSGSFFEKRQSCCIIANVELIQAHFRNDNSAASSLPEFVSAELARLSQGCSSDGQHMQAASSGFHPARQSSPSTRKVTRGYGLHVVRDMVCVCTIMSVVTC